MTTGKRVQRIGHETAAANSFTGLIREITVDLGKKALRVHDGLIPGGSVLALEDLSSSPAAVGGVNDGKMTASQATELTNATAKDAVQDSRLDGMDTLNTTQDDRLTTTENTANTAAANNTTQDAQIGINLTDIAARLVTANNLSDVPNAAEARTNLNVDAAGADNSVDVTLAGETYLTIAGQVITAGIIDVATQTTGIVATANGGTGATGAGQARINLAAAAIASPTFTGTPRAPTAAVANDSTQIATTAFVQAEIEPPTYTDYVTTTNTHILTGNTVPAGLSVVNITSIESIGPTGSGAVNIWASLDFLPTTTKWILLRVKLDASNSILEVIRQAIYVRNTGSTVIMPQNGTQIAEHGDISTVSITSSGFECMVPIDSSRRFDLLYTKTGSLDGIEIANIFIVGFGT